MDDFFPDREYSHMRETEAEGSWVLKYVWKKGLKNSIEMKNMKDIIGHINIFSFFIDF